LGLVATKTWARLPRTSRYVHWRYPGPLNHHNHAVMKRACHVDGQRAYGHGREDKLRIVREALAAHAVVTEVARR